MARNVYECTVVMGGFFGVVAIGLGSYSVAEGVVYGANEGCKFGFL